MNNLKDPINKEEITRFITIIDAEDFQDTLQLIGPYLDKYDITAIMLPIHYDPNTGKFDHKLRRNERQSRVEMHALREELRDAYEFDYDQCIIICDYDKTIVNNEMFATFKTFELMGIRRIKMGPKGFTQFSLLREFKRKDII